jgi:NAD(P)-dependent dehydrogenase (short-subunit alcohol dehydrogenase family)
MGTEASTVLITGATGRLGRSFALGFAAMHWNVAFTSRNEAAARALEQECLECGARRVAWLRIDLATDDAASAVAAELAGHDMLAEVLINSARDLQHLKVMPSGRPSRLSWIGELVLDVVLPYELTMSLVELPASPLRSVINIASIYGISATNAALYERPTDRPAINYGVAKAALIHLTKELAVRLAPRGIAVNAVSYGGVRGRADEAFQERYARMCPVGRMLDVSEVFGAVRFLASGEAQGMTGHNLVVDGGWTLW